MVSAVPIIHVSDITALLLECYGQTLEHAEVEKLAAAILPFVQRSRLPLHDAVCRIATNYHIEAERVAALHEAPLGDAWQAVLVHILKFASRLSRFPSDQEAVSWPDLDAAEDVRSRLSTYNFEGSLDTWVSVAVTNRVRRYWRDQQSLGAGGQGFKSTAQRDAEREQGDISFAPRNAQESLDHLREDDRMAQPSDATQSVEASVQEAEFRRAVAAVLAKLAKERNDPDLPRLWEGFAEHEFKLHELAVKFDLNIWQVQRRLAHTRKRLRQDPTIQRWRDQV